MLHLVKRVMRFPLHAAYQKRIHEGTQAKNKTQVRWLWGSRIRQQRMKKHKCLAKIGVLGKSTTALTLRGSLEWVWDWACLHQQLLDSSTLVLRSDNRGPQREGRTAEARFPSHFFGPRVKWSKWSSSSAQVQFKRRIFFSWVNVIDMLHFFSFFAKQN